MSEGIVSNDPYWGNCEFCGNTTTLRPYGKNRMKICLPCAMLPENEAEVSENMNKFMEDFGRAISAISIGREAYWQNVGINSKRNYMDTIQWVRETHKCCDCGRPLWEDAHPSINIVQLPYRAPGQYPQFGNVLEGTSGMAGATLCSICTNKVPQEVKFALEYRGQDVIYHPVAGLEKMDA